MRHRLVIIAALLASCSPPPSESERKVALPAAQTLPANSAEARDAKATVERYFALIAQRKFAEARMFWDHDGADSGGDAAAFAGAFDRFTSYAPSVGAPTEIKVQGNMHYVAVAASATVTEKRTGRRYTRAGTILLRRPAGNAGKTGPWRIWGMDLREKH